MRRNQTPENGHLLRRTSVPSVDGANGAKPSTTPETPDRSRSASSMHEPPTSIDATNVSALRPAPEPAQPAGRTVSSINASNPSRSLTVPANNNPASATKDRQALPVVASQLSIDAVG